MESAERDIHGRIHGLDYLRFLCCLSVVAWHTRVLDVFPLGKALTAVISYNGLLLAVPSFFLISLFLLNLKLGSGLAYVSRRLVRLFFLSVFWSCIYILFYGGFYVGPYFFLIDLLFLTFVSFLVFPLSQDDSIIGRCMQYFLLICSCALMMAKYYGYLVDGSPPNDYYMDVANFLPFVPAAGIIYNGYKCRRMDAEGRAFNANLSLLAFAFIAISCCVA